MPPKITFQEISYQLQEIVHELKTLNKEHMHLKESVEKIQKQTNEHHDKLLTMSTGANIFWSRIWPNLGWVLAIATSIVEIKKFIH